MKDPAWRWISASVKGTSHLASGTECQDNHSCAEVTTEDGPILLAFASDGAGSARRSAVGSQMICDSMRSQVMQFFEDQGHVEEINARLVASWIEQFRDEVILEAESKGIPDREFACTILGAIVGPASAAFFQVGDGAIVYSLPTRNEYLLAFWPERGEYENTTCFATQADVLQHIQFALINDTVFEVALFSDGLQRLALSYQTREPHQPFFSGFFPMLRSTTSVDLPHMNEQLAQFLDSPRVNGRTDDDKTLILAVLNLSSGAGEAHEHVGGVG